jgi:hypothetical protein
VGLVALLDAEIVVQQLDVEIRMDQLLLDEMPDDAGHLVAVHLDDRIADLDFRHWGPLRNADDGESRRVTGRPYGAAGPILQGQNICMQMRVRSPRLADAPMRRRRGNLGPA